jgi:DNA-binding transcriptional ArsR family regulator
MSTPVRLDNHALLNALNHPLRRQILRVMPDGEATSPRELAEWLDEPLGNLSYHVRVLAGCGALELVDEKRASVTAGWARSLLEDPDWGPPREP